MPATQAQTYPDYSEIYVNDFADLLTNEQESNIRADLNELRTETGIEFTVVTIETMGDYGYSGAIEPFATGLFNQWGVGDADRNDGVMMLVSRYDREMRIEVGSGYGRSQGCGDERYHRRRDHSLSSKTMPMPGVSPLGVDSVIRDLTGSSAGRIWRAVLRQSMECADAS